MTTLVDTVIEDARWEALDLPDLAETAAKAALRGVGLVETGFEIALLATDDARIAGLNGQFRGKPAPTNVLSWPSEERGAETPGARPLPPDPGELGDIALAYDTCAREAGEAGRSLRDHTAHLIVHGVLHLLGYDHERDADATLMEGLEVEILGKLGIADPYRVTG